MDKKAKARYVRFADLSEAGKLNALRKWQPDYFDMATGEKAACMAHWNSQPIESAAFMSDNSGRM